MHKGAIQSNRRIKGRRRKKLKRALHYGVVMASATAATPSGWAATPSSEVNHHFPTLRTQHDAFLQHGLEELVSDPALRRAIREKRFAAALVDITDLENPRYAGVNGDVMMYAASLPKIAIMLGAFQQAEMGNLDMTAQVKDSLTRMIRNSSNSAATEMYYAVGPSELADILRSPEYGLYDAQHNGGLWVGKPYAKQTTWKRDPIHNISHGASAMQVARFYYLMETGRLVNEEASKEMKEMLSKPAIRHKFVKGLSSAQPESEVFRKSGTWRTYHSDSGVIERDGKRYIAVMLANDNHASDWLTDLIIGFDKLIHEPSLVAHVAEVSLENPTLTATKTR
jgi:beta-lactamase class A